MVLRAVAFLKSEGPSSPISWQQPESMSVGRSSPFGTLCCKVQDRHCLCCSRRLGFGLNGHQFWRLLISHRCLETYTNTDSGNTCDRGLFGHKGTLLVLLHVPMIYVNNSAKELVPCSAEITIHVKRRTHETTHPLV